MIYLYRFELVSWEEGTSHPFVPQNGVPEGPRYLLTNAEAPVSITDPGGPVFLPSTTPEVVTFEPVPISHDGIRLDGEADAGTQSVYLPVTHPLAQAYSLDPGGYRLWLRVFRLDGGATYPEFTGLVADFDYGEQMLNLQVQPLELVLAQQGLTAKHPRSCPKMVFSQACRATAFSLVPIPSTPYSYYKHAEQGQVASVSADGLVVTIPEAANRADGFFVGGVLMLGPDYIAATSATPNLPTRAQVLTGQVIAPAYTGLVATPVHGGYRRTVIAHVGSSLTLQAPLPPGNFTTGKYSAATMLAGCDGAQATCINVFGNGRNFGGYPFIPLKDPNKVGILQAL